MEVTRNNINVVPQQFLEFLSVLPNVNNYNYNCIDKTLSLDVVDGFDESVLDNYITTNDITTGYIELNIDNIVIGSVREFHKKVKKESSIKNKIQSYVYDATAQRLKIKVDSDWSTANTTTLDNTLDNLAGYDVVIQLMDGYVTKAKDGVNYYNRKRSELVNDIHLGLITSADAFIVDSKLKDVKDSLLTGDWITAQTYLSFTTVEGEYTQERKDLINTELQEYIDNNY